MLDGKTRQCLVTAISQLSVMVAGASYSWFEPITQRIIEDPRLSLTARNVSWLISLIELGCFLSSLAAGYLADRFGRKMVILSVGPISLMGWLLVLSSMSLLALTMMRCLHGVATGIAFAVQPIYTAEVAEPKLRGRLSGTFQTALYAGALYIFCIGPYFQYNAFVFLTLPLPLIFMALFSFCPETPYYLLMTGKEEEARLVLKSLRDSKEVDEELEAMRTAVKEQMSGTNSFKTLFCVKSERKAFVIVQIVCAAKFLTGMPVIINYAVETFSKSDSFFPPAEMSIILAVLLTSIAVLSALLSDWIGRKPLLLVSCFGCFVSHIFTGLYYFINEKTALDSKPYVWMLYLGLSLYCVFSDIGLGPLLQTLQSEMFGASTRGLAGGLTEGLGAIFAFVALKAYTPVNEEFGVFLNFWFYGAVALVSGILLAAMMHETAGKPIGQMEMGAVKSAS